MVLEFEIVCLINNIIPEVKSCYLIITKYYTNYFNVLCLYTFILQNKKERNNLSGYLQTVLSYYVVWVQLRVPVEL